MGDKEVNNHSQFFSFYKHRRKQTLRSREGMPFSVKPFFGPIPSHHISISAFGWLAGWLG